MKTKWRVRGPFWLGWRHRDRLPQPARLAEISGAAQPGKRLSPAAELRHLWPADDRPAPRAARARRASWPGCLHQLVEFHLDFTPLDFRQAHFLTHVSVVQAGAHVT